MRQLAVSKLRKYELVMDKAREEGCPGEVWEGQW